MTTEPLAALFDTAPAGVISLGRALDELAATYDSRTAVIGPEPVSFIELRERARRVASGLQGLGVRPGDKIGILGENGTDWITTFFGTMYAGATAVGINTWYTPREIEQVLGHARVRVLVGHAGGGDEDSIISLATSLVKSRDASGYAPEHVILKGDALPSGVDDWRRLSEASASELSEPAALDAPAAIIYTSGSTAAPKGVALSHASLVRNAISIGRAQGLDASDRVWSHFPFFFSGGLCNFLLGGLLSGGTLVVHPTFDVDAALREVQSGECTAMHCWPNIIRRLIDHAGFDASRTTAVRKGTWPVDLWFGERGFPYMRGVNLYGLTETCTMFTATTPDDSNDVRSETHGRPFPGNAVKVVDEVERPCEPGAVGEIRLKGPTVMLGYHGQSRDVAFDAGGYLRTRDIGALRDDGRLVWHGRSDDMIRTNGINVSPVEVETILESLEGVRRAGVLGIADDRRGERVVALVALDPRASLDEGALIKQARTRLAAYKTPREVRVIEASEFPTTGSGKIDRRRLQDIASEIFDE